MTKTKATVFLFAQLRKQLRSHAELAYEPRLVLENPILKTWATKNGYELTTMIIETTTYRRASFAKTARFREAIRLAGKLKSELVIADIGDLLRRTVAERIQETVIALDSLQTDVWD